MRTQHNISPKRTLYLLPFIIFLLAFAMPACDGGGPNSPVEEPPPDPDPPPSTDNRIEAIEETITEALPPVGTPLEEQNFLEEVRAVGQAMVELPDVDTVLVMGRTLTVQTIFNDGTTHLFINNRPPDIDSDASSPSVPGTVLHKQAGADHSSTPGNTTSAAGPPESDRAVVTFHDGGQEVAGEINQMVSNAGYEVLPLNASIDDMRNYTNLGILYLDTHGTSFFRFAGRSADGSLIKRKSFGIQTSTVIDGTNLNTYADDLEKELLIWTQVKTYDEEGRNTGTKTEFAITEKFIEEYWSFENGVVVLHVCFAGADRGQPTENLDPTVIRRALFDNGAKLIMSFDDYTATSLARPSILHFFDRLLGANSYLPEEPPLRPFDAAQVFDDMREADNTYFFMPEYLTIPLGIQTLNIPNGRFLVNVKLFTPTFLDRSIIAPSIRNFDVVDDAAQDQGRIILHGSFGEEKGTVEVDDLDLEVESWSEDKVIARTPFTGPGSTGEVSVKAPGEVESNKVPLTEWQGTITLTNILAGSLKGEVVIDARFRGDVHAFRKKLAEDAGHREVTTYLSPSSNGRSKGSGSHSLDGGTTTWFGNYEMKILNKDQVDSKSLPPKSSVIGGKISINPDEEKAEICLGVRGKVGVRADSPNGTAETFVYNLPTNTMLLLADRTEIFYGCIDANLDGNSYIIEGDKRSGTSDKGELKFTLEWTDLQPIAPPDDDTAG